MTLTKFWERDDAQPTSTSALPAVTTVVNTLDPSTHPSATLLRSRFYPSVTYAEGNVTAHSQTSLLEVHVLFVAWYDQLGSGAGSAPYPYDQDTRIVATAQLQPRYFPALVGPTSAYYVRWNAEPACVESFAQRKPDIAVLTTPQLYSGIFVTDQTAAYYVPGTNKRWTFECYGEALFGY